MIKFEFEICSPQDMLLGINTFEGEDEEGYFSNLSIGLIFVCISIKKYITQT